MAGFLPTLVDLLPREARIRRRVLKAAEAIVGERRFERVFFSLQDLLRATELQRDQVARALRELLRLEAFDYVPPFRGRAIRMIERDKPFDEIEIDFEALRHRKAAEYEKLNRVIRFALSGGCRQREILRYFGERNAPHCGHCDNCGKSVAMVASGSRIAVIGSIYESPGH